MVSQKPLISPLVRRYLERVQQRPDTRTTVNYVAPTPHFSSHSLAMPGDTQETILRQLCALIQVPFADTPALQHLTDFATLVARGSDAVCPPWALYLFNHKGKSNLSSLTILSDALQAQRLPIELQHLVEDAQRRMPAIDPNTVLHISSIQLPSQGCCVPRRKTLAVSEPVRAALSALNETVMADMSARVLLELQKEYPLYAQNNILYAICLTVVMLVCYESLRNAAAAHAAAKHEEAFQLKQAHEHLMNRSRESLKSTLETSKAAVIASAAVSQVSLNQGLKASMDITEVVAQEVAEQLASKQEDRQSILTDASSKSHTTGLLYSPSPAPLLSALSITPSLVNMQATLSPSAPLRSSTFSGPLGRAATTSAMQALKQASGTVGKNGVLPGQLFDHDGDVTETLWK